MVRSHCTFTTLGGWTSPKTSRGPTPWAGTVSWWSGVRSHDVERSRRALSALPVLLLLSVLSPAAREEWGEHRTPRVSLPLVSPSCVSVRRVSCRWLSLSNPKSGVNPLFTENPHAPMYPASQQYTWVTSDIVVLQSISMRLPYQPGALGAEGVALTLALILGMENDRMHQAIELIDAEVAFVRLNPDEIVLDPVASPPSLEIRLDAEAEETVAYRRYDIKSTAFGTDVGGAKVGEVVSVAKASWADSWTCWLLYGHWLIRPWQRTARPSRGFSRGSTHADVWLNSVLSDGSGYAKCVATGRSSGPPRAP